MIILLVLTRKLRQEREIAFLGLPNRKVAGQDFLATPEFTLSA